MSNQQPPRRPTIRDVARGSGVSVATVSYALNHPERIGEAQRLRVLEAVAALGYQPNRLAQGLRSGQSRLVGISVPNLASAYYSELVNCLETAAGKAGYQVLQALHHHRPDVERLRIGALLDHRIAGLLTVPSGCPAAALELVASAEVPTIVLDRPLPDARFDQVTFDNRAAMTEVTQHLLRLGHRHIALAVSHPDLPTTRLRIETLEGMAGDRARVSILRQDGTEAEYQAQMAEILNGKAGATVVIASNTRLGLWTMRGLRCIPLAVPDDVSMLVFDRPDWADIVTPRLSVVETPAAAMAEAAWSMLLGRIAGGGGATETVQLRATVRFDHSVAPPRPA